MNSYEDKRKNDEMMKKFYNEICEKYDFIFPLNEIQKIFFDKVIENALQNKQSLKILDVGASTGNLSKYLIDKNLDVFSVDINEKLIEKAKNKGVDVKNINMLNIDTINKNFDLIINIGNTLPHLNSKQEVFEFLKKSFDKLENDGTIVLQLINFNKFLLQKDKENYLGQLPIIENKNVKFERFYYLTENKNIEFRTILDNDIKNSEILLNINYLELMQFMGKIGFKNIEIFGGFNKAEFDFEKSIFLVIKAQKNK